MDVRLSEEQQAIEGGVAKVCAQFGDDYWSKCDQEARFPEEFYYAMAEGGWLGITMPEELGGSGMGVTEAAVMMHAVTKAGGGFSAASAIHINLFGPHSTIRPNGGTHSAVGISGTRLRRSSSVRAL